MKQEIDNELHGDIVLMLAKGHGVNPIDAMLMANDIIALLSKVENSTVANSVKSTGLTFKPSELVLIRQWFDAVQDLASPEFLKGIDYALANKIYLALGIRVPNSIKKPNIQE